MGMVVSSVVTLYNGVFTSLQMLLEDWLLGLLARAWFAATLLFFFWNSAMTKLGGAGLVDLDAAAAQMLGEAFFIEYGGDTSELGFGFVAFAYLGTIAEFVLPLLIVIGLLTRLGSLGMILFIAVMTYVDMTAHGLTIDPSLLVNGRPDLTPAQATDAVFINSVTIENRLMWLFPLIYLVVRGGGAVSLDWLFGRLRS